MLNYVTSSNKWKQTVLNISQCVFKKVLNELWGFQGCQEKKLYDVWYE